MWECAQCRGACEDELSVCEHCGTSRDGRADADFKHADKLAAELGREEKAGAAAADAASWHPMGVVLLTLLAIVLVAYGGKVYASGFESRDFNQILVPLLLFFCAGPRKRKWASAVLNILALCLIAVGFVELHQFFALLWPQGDAAAPGRALDATPRALVCAWHLVLAAWFFAGTIGYVYKNRLLARESEGPHHE
jgi:hypothetical protein